MATSQLMGPQGNEALRADASKLGYEASQRKQELQKEKNLEDLHLRQANDDHRHKVDEQFAASKRALDEMREVRNSTHSQLRVAKATQMYETTVGSNALASAGHQALSARGEAKMCQAQASALQDFAQKSSQREKETLAMVRDTASQRVATGKDQAEERVGKSYQLTQLANQQVDAVKTQTVLQIEVQERQAALRAGLKVGATGRALDFGLAEMHSAAAKSNKGKTAMVRDLERNREAAEARVALAQRQLAGEEEESEAALAREDICAAQMKRIANELKEDSKANFASGKVVLDRMLQQATSHAQSKKIPFEEAQEHVLEKTEAVNLASNKSALSALQHAGKDGEEMTRRVQRAKRQLADLQAQCAANVSELMKRFEEAKREHAKKLAEAERQTQDLLQKCAEQKAQRERDCVASLEKNERLLQEREASVKSWTKGSNDLLNQRMAAVQQQAAERRRQAEARLEQTRRHAEEVRSRCQERVQAGMDIAREKVNLAAERSSGKIKVAEQRAQEAMEARSKALAAYKAVISRCEGAAEEARRRGLVDYAKILMPPEPEGQLNDSGREGIVKSVCSTEVPKEPSRPVTEGNSRPWTAATDTYGDFKETGSTIFPDRGGTPQTLVVS